MIFMAEEVKNIAQEQAAEQPAKPTEAKAPEVKTKEEKAEIPSDELAPEGFESFLSDAVDPEDEARELESMAKGDDEEAEEAVEEPEKEEKKEESPESWKEYKEDDLIALIEKGEDITDDQIEFLRSKGHKIEVEEVKEPEKPKEKEKANEESKEKPLPGFVDKLKDIEYFSRQKLESAEAWENATVAYIEQAEQTNQTLTKVLNDNPQLAAVIVDMANGKDAGQTLKKHFEDMFNEEVPESGTPEYDEYVIKKHQRQEALKKEQERQGQVGVNMQKSVDDAARFVKAKNLNESQAKEFFSELDKHMQDVHNGILSQDLLDLVYKGKNYEKDLQTETKKAEIRGANRKIKLEKSQPKGDGMRRVTRHAAKEIKKEVQYESDEAKMLDEVLNGM